MRELILDRVNLSSLAADILGKGGAFRFRAPGGSMHPFIRNGDVLEVRPVDSAVIRPADIILYHRENRRLIAHRVIGRARKQYTTELLVRGDTDPFNTEIVFLESVLGRVVRVQRGEKILVMDSGLWRWLGMLWIALSPLSLELYRTLISCKTRISSRKLGCEIAS